MNGKVEDQHYNYFFSIYLKHSKKKKNWYTLEIQWHKVHCHNLRDIIQLKKKKNQKEKNSHFKHCIT